MVSFHINFCLLLLFVVTIKIMIYFNFYFLGGKHLYGYIYKHNLSICTYVIYLSLYICISFDVKL